MAKSFDSHVGFVNKSVDGFKTLFKDGLHMGQFLVNKGVNIVL